MCIAVFRPRRFQVTLAYSFTTFLLVFPLAVSARAQVPDPAPGLQHTDDGVQASYASKTLRVDVLRPDLPLPDGRQGTCAREAWLETFYSRMWRPLRGTAIASRHPRSTTSTEWRSR